MRLQLLLPQRVLLDRDGVRKVVAESHHGSFVLLPNHVDFALPVLPGILLYETEEGESVVGVDRGFLVKEGARVRISVHDAVPAAGLEEVRRVVRERFHTVGEREARARSAMARLQASFYRRFIEQEGLDEEV